MVNAFAAGGADDPLITRSYIEGATYKASLTETVLSVFSDTFVYPTNRVNSLSSLSFATTFSPIRMGRNDSTVIFQGTSFTLRTGTASIQITQGEVINVTRGTVVPSGSNLIINERYFATENVVANITATSMLSGYIDGYYIPVSFIVENPSESPFTDVSPTVGYYDAVIWASSKGLVLGHEGRFFPYDNMSRAAFVLIMWRIMGQPEPLAAPIFSDIEHHGPIVGKAIAWANENGIITGSQGRFFPDNSITREAIALILWRFNNSKGGDSTADAVRFNTFTDRNRVSPGVEEAMSWVTYHEIIRGANNQMTPQGTATRAAVVLMLHRYVTDFWSNIESIPQ